MKAKKIVAVLTAAALSTSALCTTAFAAEGFSDTIKASMATGLDTFEAAYNTNMASYDEAMGGSQGEFTLTLGDTARALLGMFLPVDISWFGSLSLGADVSIVENIAAEKMAVRLNGTDLVTMRVQMDLDNMDYFMQIPEISESYLYANYFDLLEQSAETFEESGLTVGQIKKILSMLLAYSRDPLDAATIRTLYETYYGIIFDSFEDVDAGEETLTIGEISQDTDYVVGRADLAAMMNMIMTLAQTARDDEVIKDIIFRYDDDAEDDYGKFQALIDQALDTVDMEDVEEEEGYIESTLWTDKEGVLIGSQVTLNSGDEEDSPIPVVTYQTVSQGDESALLLNIDMEDEGSLAITGSGKTTDGLLDGSYVLSFGGTDLANINVEGLDVNTEDPATAGTITLTMADSIASDESMAFFSSFSLAISFESTGVTDSYCDLTVSMSGSPVASLTFTAGLGDGVEITDPATMDIIDINDQEALEEWSSQIDPSFIFTNLSNAGMPDEFLEQIMGMVMGGGDDYSEFAIDDSDTEESDEAFDEDSYLVDDAIDEEAEEQAVA